MSRKPTLAVFILRTHYPSGRTPANILKFVWLCVSSIKTGIRRTIRPDELPFIVRRSRRITNDSSSRRIMRLVPVFMLVTHNQMNFKCLPKFVQTNNAAAGLAQSAERLTAEREVAGSIPGTGPIRRVLKITEN